MFTVTAQSQRFFLYVGTYSDIENNGIYVFDFDGQTGNVSEIKQTIKISNPSFLAISYNKKYLFAIGENREGTISSYKINKKNGTLSFLSLEPTLGNGPCHLQTDFKNKWCLVGHYGSGDISIIPILAGGHLGKSELKYAYIQNEKRLTPRVHSINIAENNNDVFVPDLGLDKILHFRFDYKSGDLFPASVPGISLPQGTGPRHFAFHPNGKYAYIIGEYSSRIHVFSIVPTGLNEISSVSTLPLGYNQKNYCADIHISPDGKFLYGSNRGHNSIAIFSADKTNGALSNVGIQTTMGEWPRNFVIDPTGNFLLVANQKSNNIQIFKRDKNTGLLKHSGEIKNINQPVCLKFL